MFFRLRKSNLSLERAIYKPAQKDASGNIVAHPVRTTEYVGSVSAHANFSTVSSALLAKLDEKEKSDLKTILKKNEPKPDYWISSLPSHLGWCIHELTVRANHNDGPEAQKALAQKIKEADAQWRAFFKAAQDAGLKRKVNRRKALQPNADVAATQLPLAL